MSYVLASFSGGKDSTAMVLRMIELGEQLDEVIFCDTGMEFPAMYQHIDKVKAHVESCGIRFTTVRNPNGFEYYMLHMDCKGPYGQHDGFGWPTYKARWCTKYLKIQPVRRRIKEIKQELKKELGKSYRKGLVIQCIGLAADETKRLEREHNLDKTHRHPLAEWGWTEKDCLEYCYSKGYDWYDPCIGKGLYEIFDRTSCWICPLGTRKYHMELRRNYPG